jgi:uncharacterized membrane protein YdbT with pleckstrin-like domain
MPYPEKLLADDEQVVENYHPHWITLVPATLWFLVICAAGGAGIALSRHSSGTTGDVLTIAVIVVGLILICWLAVPPWIRWRSSHYVFTTHRVLIRTGVFKHEGRDISLQRISDVGFSRTLWDRVVGAGTLTIESAGENGQQVLVNVPHSDEAQQTLNKLIEQDHDRRAYGSNQAQQPGYQPGPPPPGYQAPPPGYQTPPPGYQPPPPGYEQYPPTRPYRPQQ